MVYGNVREFGTLGNEKSTTYRPSTTVYSSNPTLTARTPKVNSTVGLPCVPDARLPLASWPQIESLHHDSWRLAARVLIG